MIVAWDHDQDLRHYEKRAIVPLVPQREWLHYGENAFLRARHVIGLRRLGLSIKEVRDLLNRHPTGTTRRQRLLGLLDEKVRDIDETIAVLQGRRDDLASRYLALFDIPPERDDNCICEALFLPCIFVKTADTVDNRPQILQEDGKSA